MPEDRSAALICPALRRCIKVVGVLTLLGAMACPLSAQAIGWRYADWGMTPDQLAAASGGEIGDELAPIDAGGGRQEVRTRVHGDGTTFEATFGFMQGRLADVTLRPFEPSICPQLKDQILSSRGAPLRSTADNAQTQSVWYDDDTAAELTLTELGADDFGCRLSYSGGPAPTGRRPVLPVPPKSRP